LDERGHGGQRGLLGAHWRLLETLGHPDSGIGIVDQAFTDRALEDGEDI
jgi:hypothetical protein